MENPGAQQDVSASQGIRMMFYMMKPSETSFQTVEAVPDYVKKATPFFISLILLELVISWILKGKPSGRLDDSLTSMSAGVVSRLPSLFFRSFEVTSYIYIWENYRLLELPWDCPWTWYLTFLGVDFGYYWFHRMAHGKVLGIVTYAYFPAIKRLRQEDHVFQTSWGYMVMHMFITHFLIEDVRKMKDDFYCKEQIPQNKAFQ